MRAVTESFDLSTFWNEIEMVDRMVEALKDRGWKFVREFRGGTHGRPDLLVMPPDQKPIVVEAKVSGHLLGLGQLLGYQYDFPKAALALLIPSAAYSDVLVHGVERIGASIWLAEGRPEHEPARWIFRTPRHAHE